MTHRISLRLNRGVQINPEDDEQDGGTIYPPRRNTYLGPIAPDEKLSGTITIPEVEGQLWRDDWQGMRWEIIGPDYVPPPPPATSDGDRLKQAIEQAIAAGNSASLSFSQYGITVPNGWKLELTAPPPPSRPILDTITDAINTIDGLTVVDPGTPTVQIELPLVVVYYAGHDRPTGSELKERVMVDVLVDWAIAERVQHTLSETANSVIAVLEGLSTARLIQVDEFVALPVPSDPNAEALALQFIVQEA